MMLRRATLQGSGTPQTYLHPRFQTWLTTPGFKLESTGPNYCFPFEKNLAIGRLRDVHAIVPDPKSPIRKPPPSRNGLWYSAFYNVAPIVAFPRTWIHEGGAAAKSVGEGGQGGGVDVASAKGAEERVPGISLMRLKMTNKSSQVRPFCTAIHTLELTRLIRIRLRM